jgi:hypothetical protein
MDGAGILVMERTCFFNCTSRRGAAGFMYTSQEADMNLVAIFSCIAELGGGGLDSELRGHRLSMMNFSNCEADAQTGVAIQYSAGAGSGDNDFTKYLIMKSCIGAIVMGAFGQVGGISTQISRLTCVMFADQTTDSCVKCDTGSVKLFSCGFAGCTYAPLTSGTVTMDADCYGSGANSGDPSLYVSEPGNCGPLDWAASCVIARTCVAAPNPLPSTAMETDEESGSESSTATLSGSGAESPTESVTSSGKESRSESAIGAGSQPSSEAGGVGSASSAIANGGPTSNDGGSRWKWIGVAAGVVAGVVLTALAICWLIPICRRPKSEEVRGEEEKIEVLGASAPQAEGAAGSAAAVEEPDSDKAGSDHEGVSDHEADLGLDGDHSEKAGGSGSGEDTPGGSGEPAAEAGTMVAPREEENTETGSMPVKAERRKRTETGSSEAAERDVRIVEVEPVRVVSSLGGKATLSVAMPEKLWARRRFEARFEPEHGELWLSTSKGWMEPGAVEMPFVLFFEPSSEEKLESTLIVDFGEFEVRARVVGSTGVDHTHRHRRHGE